MKILVAEPEYFSAVMPRLKTLGRIVIENAKDVDIIITRSRMQIDKAFLNQMKNLKIVATATTGLDHIDMEECKRRGIKIIDAAGANAEAVAEFTVGLMLGLAKGIQGAHLSTRKGEWKRQEFVGSELGGKTLGLIGFGRIGRKTGEIARSLGMNIVAHDPYLSEKFIRENGAQPLSLNELLEKSDFVSIHCNLSEETKNMINSKSMGRMKKNAFLINTARGEMVNENALLSALKEKTIAGAALDVFEKEPLQNKGLINYAQDNNNLIITPHIAGLTTEAVNKAAEIICKKLEREMKNKQP